MEKNMSIILVADNPKACQNYAKHLNNISDTAILCATDKTSFAIALIKECQPDAVILDLKLGQGDNHALSFLKTLNNHTLPAKPYLLIVANDSDTQIHDQARKLGADFILSKHQGDFSEKNALEFLRLIKNTHQLLKYSRKNHPQNIRQLIYHELNCIGISPKAVGYDYLADAILLLMQGDCHNICSTLADRYDKSPFSIERAMQNAIDKTWRTTSTEYLTRNYTAHINSKRGIPTLMEFVHYYAIKLKYH